MSTDAPSGFCRSSSISRWLRSLAPGIITAAIVFGPSKMTITSKLAANYQFNMIWVVVVAIYFMVLFTEMASRIGIATNQSLLQVVRQKWGKTISIIVGIGVFFVASSFQSGNSIGAGIALSEPTHTPVMFWIILFNILGIGLLLFNNLYSVLEKLMIGLVALMLLAFVLTAIKIKPDLSNLVRGLVPSIPNGSEGLIIAFVASCFSLVAAFYQCYLVQERKKQKDGTSVNSNESIPGILILGLLVIVVMICAGSVLFPRGIQVNNAMDVAAALDPVFGGFSSILFLAGFFGASFSSLIGNAAIGGTLLGDALGMGFQLNNPAVKGLIALVMIIGGAVAIFLGKNLPLQLIVMAQSVTIFIVPMIGFSIFFIANDEKLMGKLKNTFTHRVMGLIGLLMIMLLAVYNGWHLFVN